MNLNPVSNFTSSKPSLGNNIPGLHIIANFQANDSGKLSDYSIFKTFIESQIIELGLISVGEVYHNFPGGGYTAVLCLTESHLSIHTWPEHNYLTFDVFLSNYLKDNRNTTQAIYEAVKHFFDAEVVFEKFIDR